MHAKLFFGTDAEKSAYDEIKKLGFNCFDNGSFPVDVLIPFRENNKQYKIDDIREILKDISRFPQEGDIKVYFFKNAEELSHRCQDMLLKSVEEPPDFVKFIFSAFGTGNILPTLLSRVEVINVSENELGDSVEQISTLAMEIFTALQTKSKFRAAALLSSLDKSNVSEVYKHLLLLTGEEMRKTPTDYNFKLCKTAEKYHSVLLSYPNPKLMGVAFCSEVF